MLVNRAKAEEAAEILGLAPLDHHVVNVDRVKAAYKEMAKTAHPDAGGSAEAFARVDWAKHALIAWLGKNPAREPEMPVKGDPCPVCTGTGRVKVQNGFKSALTRLCQMCQGTGEVMDIDRKGEGL